MRQVQWQGLLTSTVALVRDVGSMAIGFYIFLHEESHRPSDGFLLLAGVALIGGPAALQFALLLRAARGTESPSSQPAVDSPARPSQAPSSSSSPGG